MVSAVPDSQTTDQNNVRCKCGKDCKCCDGDTRPGNCIRSNDKTSDLDHLDNE